MNKSCKTCKWVSGICCNHPTGVCTHKLYENKFFQKWEAKKNWVNKSDNRCIHNHIPEAKMERIQMTEKQAREMLASLGFDNRADSTGVLLLKKTGFIKKDIVEEVEEILNEFNKIIRSEDNVSYITLYQVDKIKQAIQHLKGRQIK